MKKILLVLICQAVILQCADAWQVKGRSKTGAFEKPEAQVVKPEIPAPAISLILPSKTPVTSFSGSLQVTALIQNVANESNVELWAVSRIKKFTPTKETTLNGLRLTWNVDLVVGSNSFELTATNAKGKETKALAVIYQLPPIITLIAPSTTPSSTVSTGTLQIIANVHNIAKEDQVSLVAAQRGLKVAPTAVALQNALKFMWTVDLIPGLNTFDIVAVSDTCRVVKSLSVTYQPPVVQTGYKGSALALLIANDEYDNWPRLANPINDAQTIAKELETSYGFKTELIRNVTRDEILAAIRKYSARKYSDDDELLILFAGHGQFDETFKEGYVVARDSKLNDEVKTSYIAHSNLRQYIDNIPCKHIFLMMDVCFAGTFDPLIASRGSDDYGEISRTEFIERKTKFRTRKYVTSGGKEYVPDGRPGQHSPFARKILDALRSYGGKDGVLTINEILTYVEKVRPEPRAGEFGSNEPGSDFIFIAR